MTVNFLKSIITGIFLENQVAMKSIVFCTGIRGMRFGRRRYGDLKLPQLGSVASSGRGNALDVAEAH